MQTIFGYFFKKNNYSSDKSSFNALSLALLSAIILGLALNIAQLWILEWVGLVPLFIALRNPKSKTHLIAIIFSISYFGLTLNWILVFGFLPWLIVLVFQAIYLYVFCIIADWLLKRKNQSLSLLIVPSLWVIIQFLRSLGAYGFTWGGLCHSQAYNLPILQIASITGCWGIEFLICMFNFSLAEFLTNKTRYKSVIAVSIIILAISAFGYYQIKNFNSDNGKQISVRLVQGNVEQDVIPDQEYLEQTLSQYISSSININKPQPNITIWPETTLPIDLLHTSYNDQIQQLSNALDSTFVIGAYSLGKRFRNSAYFYEPNTDKPKLYSKVRLVPFGEYVPLRKHLKIVESYGVRPDDLESGLSYQPINIKQGKAGTAICFESLFPQISRLLTKRGAQYLFIITNDAWFNNTQAARLHFAMAKIRAVENHRWIARGAATGVSGVIDPIGRTVESLPIFKRGIIDSKIYALDNLTFYSIYGDYFAYLCGLIVVIALLSLRCFGKFIPER